MLLFNRLGMKCSALDVCYSKLGFGMVFKLIARGSATDARFVGKSAQIVQRRPWSRLTEFNQRLCVTFHNIWSTDEKKNIIKTEYAFLFSASL